MMGDEATKQPPSQAKRARLAAEGLLPYEPSVVYAAALIGMLLLFAASGPGWFQQWQALLAQAWRHPDDLAALGDAAGRLLGRVVGGLLAVSLLSGWGAGWMQRRTSPPAAQQAATGAEHSRSRSSGAPPRWFSLLLAATGIGGVAAVAALLLSRRLPPIPSHLEGWQARLGLLLLLAAAADLTVALALLAWRHRRFAQDQAMSRAEQREERREAAPSDTTREALRARRG